MTFTPTQLRDMADAFDPTSRIRKALEQAADDAERLEKYREAMKHIRDSTFRSAVALRGYADERIEGIDTARLSQEKKA
jgi:hypothetical protein